MNKIFKKTIYICGVNMYGPDPIDSDIINSIENYNGNYALGYLNNQGDVFIIKYVGRGDLKDRLDEHTKDDLYNCINDNYSQPYFAFVYLENEKDSYNLECIMYHEFENLLNINHPAFPKGKIYPCPYPYCDHGKSE